MYALAPLPRTAIVAICATDPLSRSGTLMELSGAHGISVVDEADLPPDGVALVIADEMDEATARTIRALRRQGVARVALLVTRLDDHGLMRAAEAGVSGILRRAEASGSALRSALLTVAAGEGTLSPDLLGRLLDQVGHLQRQVLAPRGLTFRGLTEREVDVLRLLADGLDTAEIGGRLYYSERTIKNIVHDITSRLELRNRTHAVAYAIRQGLI